MHGGWLRVVVFCSGLSAPSLSAAAAPPVTRIEWDAPVSCPDLSTVSARIAALRGNAEPDFSGLGSVRGVIRREGGRFVLTLELLDGGERESRLIAGDACADLAEAAAVAIAIALDGSSVEPAAGDPATDAPTVEGATRAVEPGAVPAARLMAHALLDTAALAQPALGVGAEVRADRGGFALGAYGAWLPPQSDYVTRDRFVDFSLWFAGARVCRRLFDAVLEGAACASFDAGVLRAAGSGLARSREVRDPWLAPGAAFELGAGLWQQLGLQGRAEVVAPLVRRPYVVNETDAVHRLPLLVPRLWLGLVWAVD
jgi:hypothetical protein